MFTQLEPPIPVFVTENQSGFPSGLGLAVGVTDYGIDHQPLWVIGMDAGGDIYWVPNPLVRLQFNASVGRRPKIAGSL